MVETSCVTDVWVAVIGTVIAVAEKKEIMTMIVVAREKETATTVAVVTEKETATTVAVVTEKENVTTRAVVTEKENVTTVVVVTESETENAILRTKEIAAVITAENGMRTVDAEDRKRDLSARLMIVVDVEIKKVIRNRSGKYKALSCYWMRKRKTVGVQSLPFYFFVIGII